MSVRQRLLIHALATRQIRRDIGFAGQDVIFDSVPVFQCLQNQALQISQSNQHVSPSCINIPDTDERLEAALAVEDPVVATPGSGFTVSVAVIVAVVNTHVTFALADNDDNDVPADPSTMTLPSFP